MTKQAELNLDDHEQMAKMALAEYQRFVRVHLEAMGPDATPESRKHFLDYEMPRMLGLLMLQAASLQHVHARTVQPVLQMPHGLLSNRS